MTDEDKPFLDHLVGNGMTVKNLMLAIKANKEYYEIVSSELEVAQVHADVTQISITFGEYGFISTVFELPGGAVIGLLVSLVDGYERPTTATLIRELIKAAEKERRK